jgi:hypothetical protein
MGPMHPQGLGQMGAVTAGEDVATAMATAAISTCTTSSQTGGRGMPSSMLWRTHAIQTAPIVPARSLTTSQEGIVDLQKFIFDGQYVLHLRYNLFYLTTIYCFAIQFN